MCTIPFGMLDLILEKNLLVRGSLVIERIRMQWQSQRKTLTIGHVPRAISPICSIFIRRGGTIKCLITGGRRYSSDLPQGGLEIPCVLTFETTKAKEGMKTQRVLDNAGFKVCLELQQQNNDGSADIFEGSSTQTVAAIPVHPCSVELTTKDVQGQSITERFVDTEHIIMGEKLNDKDIKHAQKILKAQFPKLNGLRLTLYQDKPSEQATDNWMQVIHCLQRDHWILATTIGCDDGMVLVYDSVFRNVDEPTKRVLYNVSLPYSWFFSRYLNSANFADIMDS